MDFFFCLLTFKRGPAAAAAPPGSPQGPEDAGPATLRLGNRLDCGGDAECLKFGPPGGSAKALRSPPPAGRPLPLPGAPPAEAGGSSSSTPPPLPAEPASIAPDHFATPAALLRRLRAEAGLREELRSRVRDSFQVLSECPWVSPRAAWVVVSLQSAAEGGGSGGETSGGESVQAQLYTMRTRQDREEEGAELAQLMGWGAGDARVGLSKMHDGALAFAAEAAALDFCDSLEAEANRRAGGPPAAFEVIELDSHELFRLTAGSDALVVHFRERDDGWVPAPEDVRAELRRSAAVDDM